MREHDNSNRGPETPESPLTGATVNEVGALEMVMLADGIAYMTQGGLARLCGVAENKIVEHADAWEVGRRDSDLAQRLQEAGYEEDGLRVRLDTDYGRVWAYVDQVVAIFVEHYAFDLGFVTAIRSNRELTCLGLRTAIRGTPAVIASIELPDVHVPPGYFSVTAGGGCDHGRRGE